MFLNKLTMFIVLRKYYFGIVIERLLIVIVALLSFFIDVKIKNGP